MTATRIASLSQLDDGAFRAIANQLDTYFRLFLERSDDAVRTDDHLLVVTDEPHPLGSFAFLPESPSIASSRDVIARLGALDRPSAVILHRAPDKALAPLLDEHAFVLAEPMPAMGADIESLATTSLPEGYTLHELDDPQSHEQSDEWSRAFANGYELPQPVADLFAPKLLAGSEHNRDVCFFCVRHNDQIVATSAMHLDKGMAGIYCVATHPDHRAKGLGAHLTAAPLQRAHDDAYRVAILQASAMGTPVYERIGFRSFGDMMLYVRIPE
ncbi:MAG: GNAT family N-acetyltransferase [Phycisphaerales bacterium JB043]